MGIRLGDEAPDFTAETTEGSIGFHDWKSGKWAVLLSHPADYTPVCTTELGRTAALKDEFDKRNTKAIAISVDRSTATTTGRATLLRSAAPSSTSRSSVTPTARSPSSTT